MILQMQSEKSFCKKLKEFCSHSHFALLPNLQIVKSPNFQIFKLSNFQIFKLLDFQIFKLSNCQIVKLSNFQIFKLLDFQITLPFSLHYIPHVVCPRCKNESLVLAPALNLGPASATILHLLVQYLFRFYTSSFQ